jgi:pterin-4a-carbinolamine dehydratase
MVEDTSIEIAKPALSRQPKISDDEGEQLTISNLLEHRKLALHQYSNHSIVKRMRLLKNIQFDNYIQIMDYLGEIQLLLNTDDENETIEIVWEQVSPGVVVDLVRIIQVYISQNIKYECINPKNYNISFSINKNTIDDIFKNPHIFPNIHSLSLYEIGW